MSETRQTPRLARLLAPFGTDEFFADYCGHRTLVLNRDDPDRFSDIVDLAAVERYVFTANLRKERLQMLKDGESDRDEYVYPSGLVDPVAVGRLFEAGYAIVLPQAHERIASLGHFIRGLEAELSCRVQANLYLSPPGVSSFVAHYDAHDVLALQAHGSKAWQTFDSPVPVPPSERFDPERHAAGPERESFTLHQGDLVYLPSGVMHQANADDVSLHVTIGIHWVRMAQVLETLVGLAIGDEPDLRQVVPGEWWRPGPARDAVVDKLTTLVPGLTGEGRAGATLDHLRHELVSTRQPLVPDQLSQLAEIDDLDASTVVARRDPMLWDLQSGPDGVVLSCFGNEIAFPPLAATALEALMSSGADGVAVDALDTELSVEEAAVVVRRLIREGVAEVRRSGVDQ